MACLFGLNRVPLPDASAWRCIASIAVLTLGALVFMTIAAHPVQSADWRGHVLPSLAAWPGWTAFALYLATVPRRRILLLAISAGWALPIALLEDTTAGRTWIGLAPILGAATALAVDLASARTPAERSAAWSLIAASTVLPAAMMIKELAVLQSVSIFPAIADLRLAQVDGLMGFQFASVVTLAFAACAPLKTAALLAYSVMPLAIAATAGREALSTSRTGLGLIPVFVLVGLLGFACYELVPAIGPKAFFGAAFPSLHVDLASLLAKPLHDVDPTHVRNAMPSLHTTGAILIYLVTRRLSRGARWLAGGFLLLTLLATLGLGEHYLPDLVVAMPFVLLIRGLASTDLAIRAPARSTAIVAGALALVSWLVFFRERQPVEVPAAMLLLAMVATLLMVWRLERRLFQAECAALSGRAARAAQSCSRRAGDCARHRSLADQLCASNWRHFSGSCELICFGSDEAMARVASKAAFKAGKAMLP